MDEARAVCAKCKVLLSGDLVATACGHVFHASCLGEECSICGETVDRRQALDLYGICYSEQDHAALSSEDPVVAEICQLMRDCDEGELKLAELEEDLQNEKGKEEAEQRELASREKAHAEREKAKSEMSKEVARLDERYESLCLQAQSNRSRDTIHEYLDILKKSPEDAAQFLQRTVDFLEDPAPLLCQLGRLREETRATAKRLQKERAAVVRKERLLRQELGERRLGVEELQRKLKRMKSHGCSTQGSETSGYSQGLKRGRSSLIQAEAAEAAGA